MIREVLQKERHNERTKKYPRIGQGTDKNQTIFIPQDGNVKTHASHLLF